MSVLQGGPTDVVSTLDARVRARVRRDRLDPQTQASAVRSIAEEVVAEHDRLSLTGQVASLSDPTAVIAELMARVSGFGKLQPYLDDPAVEEIWLNGPSRVFVARNGHHELTNTVLTEDEVEELLERLLKQSGRRVDVSQPFVDALLPGGHRLHVALAGVARDHTAINIRKHTMRAARLASLVELGTLSESAARFLQAAVRAGLNFIVSGATQAGKTTLLNCLAAAIPGGERVISAEEVFEIFFPHPDWVALQTRQAGLEGTGEIRLRDLVKESLRMRPSRIIVGEVRAEECLDLLLALNAGVPGMCTLHANSAREALSKMTMLPLLAGENINASFTQPTVASSVDIVVHLALGADGRRRVQEIVGVTGRSEQGVIETESIFEQRDGALRRQGSGMPPRLEKFEQVGIDVHALFAEVS